MQVLGALLYVPHRMWEVHRCPQIHVPVAVLGSLIETAALKTVLRAVLQYGKVDSLE